MSDMYTQLINEILNGMRTNYNKSLSEEILNNHLDPLSEVTSGSKGFKIGTASYSVTNLQGLSSMVVNSMVASNINADGNSLTGTVKLDAFFSTSLNANIGGSVSFNFNNVGHEISSTASKVGNAISSTASKVGNGVTSVASKIGNGVTSAVSTMGNGIVSVGSSIANAFGSFFLSLSGRPKKASSNAEILASSIGISGSFVVNDVVISGTATVYADIEDGNLIINKINDLSVSTSYVNNPQVSINGAGVINSILAPLESEILSKTKSSIESLVNSKLAPALENSLKDNLPKSIALS